MANYCTNCGNALLEGNKFCTNCGFSVKNSEKSDLKSSGFSERRARVLGREPKSSKSKLTLFFIIFLPLLFGFYLFFESLPSYSNPIIKEQPQISDGKEYPPTPKQMVSVKAMVRNGKIVIRMADVKSNNIVRFVYEKNGLNTPLLTYVSNEGKLVTAISICEPCNSTTFHIRGENLICNSCGTTWDLNNLHGVGGSCQKYPPDPIPSIVVGKEIQIEVSAVEGWQRRV